MVLKIPGHCLTSSSFCHWQSWSSVIYRLWVFFNQCCQTWKEVEFKTHLLSRPGVTWYTTLETRNIFCLCYCHMLAGSMCGSELPHWLLVSLPQVKVLLKTVLKFVTHFWYQCSTRFSLNLTEILFSLHGNCSVLGVNSSCLHGKPDFSKVIVPEISFEACKTCRYPVSESQER